MTLRIRVKKPNGDSSHLEPIWSWSKSFLRSWRIFDTCANKWFQLHGTSRHLQQTSPIINTPTYHSRRSTPEFYKCRGWCQFGSCLGKRRIPLDDLITICSLAILQQYWCSTWHLDQDNIYLTEKEKQNTQQCWLFYQLHSLAQQIPPTPLWDPFMFFHILNQWYINGHHHQIYKNSLHLNPKISQPFQPSHRPRIPRGPSRKGCATDWVQPSRVATCKMVSMDRATEPWFRTRPGPRDPQNSYRKWSKSHGNIWRTYTLAMENCHAINKYTK